MHAGGVSDLRSGEPCPGDGCPYLGGHAISGSCGHGWKLIRNCGQMQAKRTTYFKCG
nr:MAG TPA: hypothetical protein [Caudoviricetes sp.]